MKDPEHWQNPYSPPRLSASTKPVPHCDARAGRRTLVILLGLLFSAEMFNLILWPELVYPWQLGSRISTSIVLAAVLYHDFWWARYIWLALLSTGFWVGCSRLWSARQPNPFFIALMIYMATFFYFLSFSRNVLAFLAAQRQKRTKK